MLYLVEKDAKEKIHEIALEKGRLALKWVHDHLAYFNPWRDNELSMEGVQALAELSIVFTRLSKNNFLWKDLYPGSDIKTEWFQYLEQQLTLPAVAELSRKRPVQAFPYLLPYLSLRSVGWRDSFYEKTLDMLGEWGFPDAQEVVPFRELDVAFFLNSSGYGNKRNLLPFYKKTFLARMKNTIFVDNDSAYSITHTIFYLSNFGTENLILIGPRLPFAKQVIESLIIHYWRIGHWDLLGELLLSSVIVGLEEKTLTPVAIEEFYSYHQDDGSVAGRRDLSGQLVEANLQNDKQQIFSLCYHTTIVSLLLSIQLLTNNHEKNY